MNIFLLCIVSLISSINQTTTLKRAKTYKFEHISSKNEKLTDYIQLVYHKDLVVKGNYYGNEDDFHFIADIKFEKDGRSDNLAFSLINYKFCDKDSNPFQKNNYSELNNLPFDLKEGVNFFGIISDRQLVLRRVFWYYDSQFDKMIFNLIKEE